MFYVTNLFLKFEEVPNPDQLSGDALLFLYLIFPVLAGLAVLFNDFFANFLKKRSGGNIDIHEGAVNIFSALIFYLIATTLGTSAGSNLSVPIIIIYIVGSSFIFYFSIISGALIRIFWISHREGHHIKRLKVPDNPVNIKNNDVLPFDQTDK